MGMGMMAAILLALAAVTAIASGVEQGISGSTTQSRNNSLKNWLRSQYPDLTEDQLNALITQFGDEDGGLWDVSKWGDQSDRKGLEKLLAEIEKMHDLYGDMPEAPTSADLERIQQEAYDEIDAENKGILDLYNSSFQNSSNLLQNELAQNAAMFGDYRNQILTNEAMSQQAIAGSTRFELDRQQRNAIVRGASAAQRLVANINAQLGTQAQSAQQSLDTSNALAQNLLAHRQAQQGIRQDYLNAQNQHNANVAGLMRGQAERRFNYGQSRKQNAIDDWNYQTDLWNENINNSGLGSVGEGIYRSRYGTGRRNSNNGI